MSIVVIPWLFTSRSGLKKVGQQSAQQGVQLMNEFRVTSSPVWLFGWVTSLRAECPVWAAFYIKRLSEKAKNRWITEVVQLQRAPVEADKSLQRKCTLPQSFQRFPSFVTDSGNECKCGRIKWILQRISEDFPKIWLNLCSRWRQGIFKAGSRISGRFAQTFASRSSMCTVQSNQKWRSIWSWAGLWTILWKVTAAACKALQACQPLPIILKQAMQFLHCMLCHMRWERQFLWEYEYDSRMTRDDVKKPAQDQPDTRHISTIHVTFTKHCKVKHDQKQTEKGNILKYIFSF